MATMVKEKHKEKKKTRDKNSSKTSVTKALSVDAIETDPLSADICKIIGTSSDIDSSKEISNCREVAENHTDDSTAIYTEANISSISSLRSEQEECRDINIKNESLQNSSKISSPISIDKNQEITDENTIKQVLHSNETKENSYKDLSKELQKIAMAEGNLEVSQNVVIPIISDANCSTVNLQGQQILEDTIPSAPYFEEIPQSIPYQKVIIENKPKVSCMPIEDVIRLYSGGEMEEVRSMSEREEEIVESGPVSGPEHPLVDLLSTFRSSLMAVERERIQLANGFADEEKSRNTLWKIDKKRVYVSEKCKCGVNVQLTATYEHAELDRERIPVAKMKLEGLLRDVQDSYCHHQHAALLAYYQIEELISEIIECTNKSVIREALTLVLVALRSSASAPDALASALERWAAALAAALIDHRDLRQLLFILHHLFKQPRSVRWASCIIQVRVDLVSPTRMLALLELLLASPGLESAQECTEAEVDEAWEEVDKHGDAGAVSDGTLRERDLLSLLHALPLRDLVARILLFKHNDIKQARPHEWGDNTGGYGVLRACYGVRVLLHVLQHAMNMHASYVRLREALREIIASALHGLACLHLSSSHFYSREIEDKLLSELEAAFFEGFQLFKSRDLHRLPATLLAEATAKSYCLKYIEQLHETATLSCNDRIRIVSQSASDRTMDHELAMTTMNFLLQTGVRRKAVQCKNLCEETARECVPQLISAHPYLHTIALHILADMNMTESLETSCVKVLQVQDWRPSTGEVRALLEDWSRRCPQLLQHLLPLLNCTPYTGISLDVQLTIGSWVCSYVRSTFTNGSVPECWWTVLRRLRTHRSTWLLPLDAPPPDEEPIDMFSIAYALLSSSWGHCIPLICSEGVAALCKLAAQRPRDAVHCLTGVMFVMAQSPESMAFTPKFTEVFTSLLSSRPSLMARALGRGGATGSDLLLRLALAQLDTEQCDRSSIVTAWLHALWRSTLPPSALGVVDTLACHTRLWPQLDAYVNIMLQEENSKEHVNHAVRNASTGPLLCECILRTWHAQREGVSHGEYGRLLNALYRQYASRQKIHVDNAIQQANAKVTSEELVIYRVANAVLVAPLNHPSHLTLWRLLLHLYLQRPPDYNTAVTPVGPLFFSGLIKTRTLGYIKKRLQETIAYHHNEAESLKTNKLIENQPQSTQSVTRSSSGGSIGNNLLPTLTIVDLTGTANSLSDCEDNDEGSECSQTEQSSSQVDEDKNNTLSFISYHKASERMLAEYLCWLEEGDRVRVMPHHADIARYIPADALEIAWKRAVIRPEPSEDLDSFPMPIPAPPPDGTPLVTPFHIAVDNILKIKDRSRRRHKRTEIKSPVEEVDFRDARNLISLVDKHLKDIEKLAQEWCSEVSRVSSLDGNLWELVKVLRVDKPLPPVRRQCVNNCQPITFTLPAREWCLSVDASRGIKENRSTARVALRRLARARPAAARTAAVLHTIARRTRSSEVGVRVVERAWRSAGGPYCSACAPAKTVLTALVTQLCERWICDNSRTCSDLLSSWGKRSSNSLQQSLCGALLSPRRLAPADWPSVYTALLDSNLPPHAVFSYLSKFEINRWSETADLTQRHDVLAALLRSVQRHGPSPPSEHQMLIEILGVHSALVMTSQDLPSHVKECTRLSIQNQLPYTHWNHIVRAIDAKASHVPFDQLGHLLRELGMIWWDARTDRSRSLENSAFTALAPHISRLLASLQRAFVATAVKLSYEPERVAMYAWSGLLESWGAWISPHTGSPPLLPSTVTKERYTTMMRHFIDNVRQVMLDCPGTEIYLLQQIFEWCVQVHMSVQAAPSITALPDMTAVPKVYQESRVQASALLVKLANLPWNEHQWFFGKSLQVALQMSASTDRELTSWCCATWKTTTAETLLRDVGDQLVPRLALLLYLFTGTLLPTPQQMLEDVCKLPWVRLPERALEEALDRFYAVHHNVAQPYHDLPQFKLILHACELAVPPGGATVYLSDTSRRKRALGVSQWVRAATSPALISHVPAHTTYLLKTVTLLAPALTESKGEVEELLSRAVNIMCIEPAASTALPLWVKYVNSADVGMCVSCVSAAAALTTFEYSGALCDAAVKSAITSTRNGGNLSWLALSAVWKCSSWQEAGPMLQRAWLHGAYLCVLAQEHSHAQILTTIQALFTANINFIDNEPIIGVWICYAMRMLRTSGSQDVELSAKGLLMRWGEQERRSLLSRVTMQAHSDQPTQLHRALCRYALYSLTPEAGTRRAFESSYTSALGSNSDLDTWTAAPQPNKLVALAVRLMSKHDIYYQYELQHM